MRPIDIPAWIFNLFNICGTARYALAYKGIPFRTEWIGWADIEVISRALGATPTGKKASGGPFYTVPMIYDPNTGEIVSDSLKIAIYLDNTYPSTPPLFPPGTQTFQAVFTSAVYMTVVGKLYRILAIPTVNCFTPANAQVYKETRIPFLGEAFGIPESPSPHEIAQHWKDLEESLDLVSSWWDTDKHGGSFITGDTPTYGDIVIAGLLIWAKVVLGEDSESWGRIVSRNDGRWGRLVEALENYEVMD